MARRSRADELVAAQGLAESPDMAARLIMAGKVASLDRAAAGSGAGADTLRPVSKPGQPFPLETRFVLTGIERFVSRGAYKLLGALEAFAIDPAGLVCLDAGASTGGFTDCLVQHGAERVYAVDVGKAQLHEKLRHDTRVVSLEGVNLRLAPIDFLPEAVDLIVADVSFISLTEILPPCVRWLKPRGSVLALIKPQFELGSKHTEKGVVRDERLRQQAVDSVIGFCRESLGLECAGVLPASIKGPKGNQEYMAWLRSPDVALPAGKAGAEHLSSRGN